MDWIRVSKAKPCPICEKPDWCLMSDDGNAIICARIESDRKCGEAGWLHKLVEDSSKDYKKVRVRKPKPTVVQDFYRLAMEYRKNLKRPDVLSKAIGVSVDSLTRMQAGWDSKGSYSFPMRNGFDKIIGIRLRCGQKKFAVAGSRAGLFWPVRVKQRSCKELWICEGPTDTAAMLDLGFAAIGRSSCNGSVEHIKNFLRFQRRQVLIMVDKDKPKKRPDGSGWRPGRDGAYRLAQEIKGCVANVRCVRPQSGKDIREWLLKGATREQVLAVAYDTRYL